MMKKKEASIRLNIGSDMEILAALAEIDRETEILKQMGLEEIEIEGYFEMFIETFFNLEEVTKGKPS